MYVSYPLLVLALVGCSYLFMDFPTLMTPNKIMKQGPHMSSSKWLHKLILTEEIHVTLMALII